MDVENCNHIYDELIFVNRNTEFRVRCSQCGEIGIMPFASQDDNSLIDSFQDSLRDDASYESFINATHNILVREYERQTGLPYFVGSRDYGDWLINRLKNKGK